MVVYLLLKEILQGKDGEPGYNGNQEIGIFDLDITDHALEIIAAMAVHNQKFVNTLLPEGFHYVFQDCNLGPLRCVDAERKLYLAGVLAAERNARKNHGIDTVP